MEWLREHPARTSVAVGLLGLVAAVFLSAPGDLFSAFVFEFLALALAVVVYVALRRERDRSN